MNAKNQLSEMLKNLGCSETCATYTFNAFKPSLSQYQCTVMVIFPNGIQVRVTGFGKRRTDADIAAAQGALDLLRRDHPYLFVDWEQLNSEAQLGDALIKLAAYLSTGQKNASEKSRLLQSLESDSHLTHVFDLWRSQGDPDLAMWGANLGEKRKATLVEALLWRRFGAQVIATGASVHLRSLLKSLVMNKC